MGSGIVERRSKRELQSVASILRGDYRVDKSTRRGKLSFQFAFVFLADPFHFRLHSCVRLATCPFELLELRAKQCHHRRVTFHYAHPAGRQREYEIRIETLPGHRVIASSGSVIDRKHQLWNRGRCHSFYKPRSGSNDPGVFRVSAHHETRYILQKEKRRLVPAAGFNKVGDFFGRVGVYDSTKLWRSTSRAP